MNDEEYIMRNARFTTVWDDLRTWYAKIVDSRPAFELSLTEDDMP